MKEAEEYWNISKLQKQQDYVQIQQELEKEYEPQSSKNLYAY